MHRRFYFKSKQHQRGAALFDALLSAVVLSIAGIGVVSVGSDVFGMQGSLNLKNHMRLELIYLQATTSNSDLCDETQTLPLPISGVSEVATVIVDGCETENFTVNNVVIDSPPKHTSLSIELAEHGNVSY